MRKRKTVIRLFDCNGFIEQFIYRKIAGVLQSLTKNVVNQHLNLLELRGHPNDRTVSNRIPTDNFEPEWILPDRIDRYKGYKSHDRHHRMKKRPPHPTTRHLRATKHLQLPPPQA